MAAIVGELCMEGLWRGWCFAMIGIKKLQDISDEGHPMVMHVFCLPSKIFGWFYYSRGHTAQFNISYVSHDMYTDFFTLTLANYFCLNNILYKSSPTKAAIFAF